MRKKWSVFQHWKMAKPQWRLGIKITILVAFIFFLLSLMPIIINQIKNKNVDQQEIVEPSLIFSRVRFEYIDLENYETFCDDCEVSLENMARIQFKAFLINDGPENLVVSIKNIKIELSEGDIIIDRPPDIELNDIFLSVGGELSLNMSGVLASELLEYLRNKEFLQLIFTPEIEYFIEDEPNRKFNFNTIMKCGNSYVGNQLPLFYAACHTEQVLK